jgi:copper homeostasis protein
MKIEICVDSVAGAVAAERGGADRVELCDNLLEGGTTPGLGCIHLARQHLRIGLQVLIRPRGGDFLYDGYEMQVIREDIRLCKEAKADGVVIGCLTADGDTDQARTRELIELARPMNVTFHRAFDMCREAKKGLEDLVALGLDRVLTSGQDASCLEGVELIAALEKQAKGRIIVMSGGGITPRNVSADRARAFGGNESFRADKRPALRGVRHQPDVRQLRDAVHENDVGWLDVAVDQTVLVQETQRRCDGRA